LRAHFSNALGDLLAGIKNIKPLVSQGTHADSIARFPMGLAVKIAGGMAKDSGVS
jgi:hypothetical protein